MQKKHIRSNPEWAQHIIYYMEKHPRMRVTGSIIATTWFPLFLSRLGQILKLIDKNNNFTLLGWGCTFVCIFIVAINAIYANFKPNQMSKEKELQSSLSIDDSLFDSCDKYYRSRIGKLIELIENCSSGKNEYDNKEASLFCKSVTPLKNLISIADGIRECLSQITPVQKSQLVISFAYQIPKISQEWKFVEKGFTGGNDRLNELVENEKSSMHYLLNDSETDYLFENDKIVAEQNGRYIYDKKDATYKNVGSIVCYDLVIPVFALNAHIILSIVSYGKKLTENEDENAIQEFKIKLMREILSHFRPIIIIEFSSLILQKLFESLENQIVNEYDQIDHLQKAM